MIQARIQFVTPVQLGQVVQVRLMLHHPMITGYDRDLQGRVIPRQVITELVCRYGQELVMRVQPSSSIAANPLVEMGLRLTKWARFEAQWVDDQGQRGQLVHDLGPQGPWQSTVGEH